LTLAILWLGVGGYRALVRKEKKQLPIDPEPIKTEVKVMAAKLEKAPATIVGYGIVRGKREVLITPEVGGQISFMNPNFEAGKRVKKGDALFTIDTQAIKILIDQIEGEISRFTAQIRTANQEAENINRNLEIITENVKLLKKEVQRYEDLKRKDIVSQQRLDSARRDYLRELNSKINYENQLAIIPLKIDELNAAITVRKAESSDAKLKLKKSKVRAAFDGIIYDKSVEISQVVKTGQTVGMLVDDAALEIPVDLNVNNIERFSFEKFNTVTPWKYPCTVFWESQKNKVQWKGYLSRIERINETNRTLRVVTEVPGRQSSKIKLAKGMFCRVVISGGYYQDAITIPPSAMRDNDTVYIFEKGRLQIKRVTVLQQSDDAVIIKSGLSPGDKVIVSALPNPVVGMRLKEKL